MENMHTDLGVEKANIILYYQPKIKVTGRKKNYEKGIFLVFNTNFSEPQSQELYRIHTVEEKLYQDLWSKKVDNCLQ